MPTDQNPSFDDRVRLMLGLLRGVDLQSADGRAGLSGFLAEVERLSPGSVRRVAACAELRALGL